jgi:hypothetical protein
MTTLFAIAIEVLLANPLDIGRPLSCKADFCWGSFIETSAKPGQTTF